MGQNYRRSKFTLRPAARSAAKLAARLAVRPAAKLAVRSAAKLAIKLVVLSGTVCINDREGDCFAGRRFYKK